MPKLQNTLIDRLKHSMHDKQINARELAQRAQVGSSFVYDILSGKSVNPTTRKLSAVADILEVSVPYLLNGEQFKVAIPTLRLEIRNAKSVLISEPSTGENLFFHRQWVREMLKTNPASLRMVVITDDSMEPTLHRGDMVMINLTKKIPSPSGMFIIIQNNKLVARKLEFSGARKTIRVLSDHPAYPNDERLTYRLQILGRIVWLARKV